MLHEEIKAKIEQRIRTKPDTLHYPVVKYQRPDVWYQPTANTYCKL